MCGFKLMNKKKKSLIALRDWWQKVESVPYVAEYQVASQFDHTTIKIPDFKGLLYFQILTGSHRCRLLTFWKDQQAYLAVKDLFPVRIDLGANVAPTWVGIHRDAKGPTSVVWRKYLTTGWAVIATLFVILGYFEKFRDTFAWIIVPVKAEMIGPQKPIDLLVGERFEAVFEVKNINSFGNCNAKFNGAKLEAIQGSLADGLRVDPHTTAVFPIIKPGEKQSFKVTGKAVKAGDYRILVEGTAKSGYIQPSSISLSSSRMIKVWYPIAIGQRRVGKNDQKSCDAEIELLVGRKFPPGLEIEAKLERVPGIKLKGVRFPRVSKFDVYYNNAVGEEVALLVWQSSFVEPMKSLSFTLMLKSEKDRTQQDWENVLKQIQFEFEEAREGS